jgi:GNAT superfamily N-acetyltransferase
MSATVRDLSSDEWRLWRSLRLLALQDSPDSFRSTYDEELAQPDAWWRDLVATTVEHPRGLLLIADVDATPVGILFGRIDPTSQVLSIGSMWVSPMARSTGVGRALLQTSLAWATEAGAPAAELWLTAGNAAAERLYQSAGFTATGETEPLRDDSTSTVLKLSRTLP